MMAAPPPLTSLRAVLFAPGHSAKMLRGAFRYPAAAAVMPDLEDSVAPAGKADARALVAELLPSLSPLDAGDGGGGGNGLQGAMNGGGQLGGDAAASAAVAGRRRGRPLVIPRVNSLYSGLLAADLAAVLATPAAVAAVSVGKVACAADAVAIMDAVAAAETAAGRPAGSVGLLPWVETAAGVEAAAAIVDAGAGARGGSAGGMGRIVGLAFGGDDLAADLGLPSSAGGSAIDYARARVAAAARSRGLACFDTPYTRFRDAPGAAAAAATARAAGYTGQFAIHPAVLPSIAAAWAPSPDQVAFARAATAAWHAAAAGGGGVGAVVVDGRVVDTPVMRQCVALLEGLHEDEEGGGEAPDDSQV
ncbi:hypothetical protein MMPV_001929 [Pyropia vietnamensis]